MPQSMSYIIVLEFIYIMVNRIKIDRFKKKRSILNVVDQSERRCR